MKQSTIAFVILLQSLIFQNSCRNDQKQQLCGDPIPSILEIQLVDKNDSLIIGKKYSQDSIKLTVNNKNVDIQVSHGIISFVYPNLEEFNNFNYIISLSAIDTDTINLIVYHNYVEDCGNYYGVQSISYNTKLIEPITGLVYKIVKN